MRTPTARERAETHVALIRARYPNPKRMSDPHPNDWYCVFMAACHYDSGPQQREIDHREIIKLNDTGQFAAAWAKLTDCYERQFNGGA